MRYSRKIAKDIKSIHDIYVILTRKEKIFSVRLDSTKDNFCLSSTVASRGMLLKIMNRGVPSHSMYSEILLSLQSGIFVGNEYFDIFFLKNMYKKVFLKIKGKVTYVS